MILTSRRWRLGAGSLGTGRNLRDHSGRTPLFLELLQRNADYRPLDTAVVYGDRRLSHAELLDRSERCGRALLALGVGPGDRVGLLLDNSPEFLVAFFGTTACRGVAVPLNLELKPDELVFYLGDAGVRCLFVDPARLELARQIVAELPQGCDIIVNAPAAPGARSLPELLAGSPSVPLPACRHDDEVIYIYSSGSTGRPKCAPRTVVQYWWEMNSVIECLQLTRQDVIFNMIPLFHNFGAVHCMLAAAGSGARLVILDRANPFALHRQRALRLIEREGATILPGVPFMFAHLADTRDRFDLASVRVCYSAAAALTPEVVRAFAARFGVPIRNHYGCTEVGVMTIDLDAEPGAHGPTVGRAFPGVGIRILDDAGAELPRGEIGEVVVTSRAMTSGYRDRGADGRALFRNGSYHTGDLGTLDASGRLTLHGRKKFVIDVVGHKVSPIEIEDVLGSHAAVRGSVVIGIPAEDGRGEQIAAYVHLGSPCTAEELQGLCAARLANFKVPRTLTFISEIPRNGLGKVLRQRELLEARALVPETRRQEAVR
ncbi:MAG: AMP-binding protein [Gammaproteobacteria bacterium]|nr:AMP-binding protein [Gammaproteobacteria bacterium]